MSSAKKNTTSKRNLQMNSSYYGRHVQKSKIGQVQPSKLAKVPRNNKNEVQIAHRREQIISSFLKNRDPSIIRIEDAPSDLFRSPKNHHEAETFWLAKIAQTRQRLDYVGKKITDQQKIAQQRQRELQEKKLRHRELLDKSENFKRKLQEETLQDEQERPFLSQQPFQRRFKQKQNEQQINSLKEDQKVLSYQIKQLESELKLVQKQYRRLESAEETEQTVEDLNQYIEENERIKQSIARLENDNFQLQQKINQLENTSKPTDELYRKFAELYEKMIMGREMEKIQRLLQVKEHFLQEREEYERNKSLLKQKKKEMSQIEKRIQDKQKQAKKLTQEIVQLSNQLLLLYHDGS